MMKPNPIMSTMRTICEVRTLQKRKRTVTYCAFWAIMINAINATTRNKMSFGFNVDLRSINVAYSTAGDFSEAPPRQTLHTQAPRRATRPTGARG